MSLNYLRSMPKVRFVRRVSTASAGHRVKFTACGSAFARLGCSPRVKIENDFAFCILHFAFNTQGCWNWQTSRPQTPVFLTCGFKSRPLHQKSTSFDRSLSIFTYSILHSPLCVLRFAFRALPLMVLNQNVQYQHGRRKNEENIEEV